MSEEGSEGEGEGMDTLRSDGHNLVLPIAKARSVDVVVRC